MTAPGLRLMRWSEDGRESLEALIGAWRDGLDPAIAPDHPPAIDLPELPSELERARALIDRRRLRTAVFGDAADLFYDPVWEILLQLFVAHEEGAALTVGALGLGSNMPPPVRRRWILAMEQRALVTCWPADTGLDLATDDRHVGLTEQAVTMLLNYMNDI